MRWHGLVFAVLAALPVYSIFVDEAFQIDFHHALLGLPQPPTTLFHKPDPASNAALLYTLSEKGFLAAVHPRNGSVIWRQQVRDQLVEHATDAYLAAGEDDGILTTAHGKSVTAWDASNGKVIWTQKIKGESTAIDLQAIPVLGSSTAGSVQDVLVATESLKDGARYAVSRLGGDGSGERWHYRDTDTKSDADVAIAASPKHVFYITKSSGIISGLKTKVVVLDSMTGKQTKEYSVALEAESVAANGKLVAGPAAAPFMVTSEKPYKTLKLNLLGSNKVSTISLEDKGEDVLSLRVHHANGPNAPLHLLVHAQSATRHWAEVFHVDSKTGDAKRAYSLPATQEVSAFTASTSGGQIFFTRVTSTEVLVYSSASHGQLGRWTRKKLDPAHAASSDPVWATAEVASRDTHNIAVRVAVTSPEGSWYLLRNGDAQWSRPEMLAYADMAAWSDDLELDALVHELETGASVDLATAYINRVYRHTQELAQLPAWLTSLPERMFSPSSETATRQNLIGSKSVILKTSRHQLFSLDAVHGKVDWHTSLTTVVSPGASIRSLASHDGRITMYTSDGSVIVVNATTGSLIETKSGSVPARQIIELPGSPASTVLKVNADGVPAFATDFGPSTPAEGNVVLTVSKTGAAQGWTIGTEIKKVWTFTPPHGKIVEIISRPAHDPIASIGRVLGDRSVLYKYSTPNLALLTSLSTDSKTMTLYLIDSVTGSVLHTCSHGGVLTRSPISSVLSENWFAYTFTSSDPQTKAISTQLIISELYESDTANDRGALSAKSNYSSFDPDATRRPHVISAAFSLSEPITNLTVTQTAQGITVRNLLAYLPHSHAIASIPRHVLDARRPLDRDPSAAEAEEGLFRYQPNLELDPKSYLTHSREVAGVQQIMTSPTLLESTSMVFAFGHDIFGTQTAPSGTFDVLGKNFNKLQLILTVVALYLGVLGIRPLVRRKVVARGWM